MHQQVLLSGGRVAVGRLQALVVRVKVRHSDVTSVSQSSRCYRLERNMTGEKWVKHVKKVLIAQKDS